MSNKSNTIQILRGFAILMVVMQHVLGRLVTNGGGVMKLIFFFNHIDVVIFFIIAGYLYENKISKYLNQSTFTFIKKKFKSIFVPYLFWALLFSVTVNVISIIPSVSTLLTNLGYEKWNIVQIIINTLTFSEYYIQHLWFVYILFIYFIIHRLSKNVFIKPYFFVFVLLLTICLKFNFEFPFILDKFLQHFLNFSLGRIICKYKHKIELKNKYVVFMISSLVLLICVLNEYYVSNSFTYTYLGNLIYGWAGCAVFFYISSYLDKHVSNASNMLKTIGDYSFEIYLMHNPYIVLMVPLALKILNVNSTLIFLISVILGILIPIFASKLISKNTLFRTIAFGKE